MPYDISVKEVEPQDVLLRHVSVEQTDLGQAIGETFGEAYAFFGRSGVQAAGPPFLVYHHGPEGGRWEADICAPCIRTAVAPPTGFGYRTVAGGTVATVLHRGPYDTISKAYTALADWVTEHGYEFAGSPREIYLSEPDVPPAEIETVLEWPVRPAAVPAASRT
jgi:effector-binding domain-containing protein